MRMRSIPALLLALSGLVYLAGCGMLSEAIKVQRAVEARDHDVDKVSIRRSSGEGKVVTVYMEDKVNVNDIKDIEEAARTVSADAKKVVVEQPVGAAGSSQRNNNPDKSKSKSKSNARAN